MKNQFIFLIIAVVGLQYQLHALHRIYVYDHIFQCGHSEAEIPSLTMRDHYSGRTFQELIIESFKAEKIIYTRSCSGL